ncbi:MAG TPA: PspC domain-containing protein [Pseudonocardia sp.]|nr:PspC domain-containing protein [Pseudonocardia sp.]
MARPTTRTLTRPRQGRIIAGVCAGLADRFGWSVFLVRLLFVLSIVIPGSQVLIYIVMWILMPNRDR